MTNDVGDFMEILIDLMLEDDLEEVMVIERESFSTPWSRHSFLRDIRKNTDSIYLTAYQGRSIAGYIGVWLLRGKIHITNLAVAGKCRRQGVATRLVNEIINMARIFGIRMITLEVRVSNWPAIKLYEKLEFVPTGYKTRYYSNNEDALIMRKEL